MRFQIPYIQPADQMLELAFKHARLSEPSVSKRIRKKERWSKEIEKTKLEEIAEELSEKLITAAESFPSFDSLPLFYQDLIDATIGLDATRQRLGHLRSKAKIIQKLKREHLGNIFRSKADSQIKSWSRQFYGRVSSIMKKLGPDLKMLEENRKELVALPNVRTDCFTVLLAGFPNVGKTTVLHRLTGSKPKIAAYPFTTKEIQLGYYQERFWDVQVLDMPGLLDRPRRNPIEQKAASALRRLDGIIVIVVDVSLSCGFTLDVQDALYKSLLAEFSQKQFWVVLNKIDIASQEQVAEAKSRFPEGVLSEPDSPKLREKIADFLKAKAIHETKAIQEKRRLAGTGTVRL